jgi:hypothetical protein
MRPRRDLISALVALAAGVHLSAAVGQSPSRTLPPATEARSELSRGAAAVAAVVAKKYPYATAYRLVRSRLERNVQEHRDSDGFIVGANLAAAFWLAALPQDLSWRETALTRHRDVVAWILPRLGLSDEEIARAVARAQGLNPAAEQRLLHFISQLAR